MFRPAPFARLWNDGAGGKPGTTYITYRSVWLVVHGIEGGEKEPVAATNRTDEFHNRYDAPWPLAALKS